MKIGLISILVAVLVFCGVTPVFAKEIKRLVTEKEKISYSIGLSIGKSFKQQAIDIEMDTLVKGVEDALQDAKPLLTEDEIREVMTNLQKNLMAKKQQEDEQVAGKNLEEGKQFLETNKKRTGVKTLPSGLQYEVIQTGTGNSPKIDDTVVTNYKGTLINGTEFDSSYKRGKPAVFPVNGVIQGWIEALQLMKPGAKWKLYIPAELAYGARSAGPIIGPNSTLIFEIELLEIKQ
jgi:FKBP-type peptidyl-prolyl cis-trans isomerase FklB